MLVLILLGFPGGEPPGYGRESFGREGPRGDYLRGSAAGVPSLRLKNGCVQDYAVTARTKSASIPYAVAYRPGSPSKTERTGKMSVLKQM